MAVTLVVTIKLHGQSKPAARSQGGTLTGEVRGLDEEAKIVAMIENARRFDHRVWVAFQYTLAEIQTNDEYYANDPNGEHLRAMDRSIVIELRRAMLCEDAPKWAKEMLPYTRWWNTNAHRAGEYPWRWTPPPHTNGPWIDWRRVDDRDYP